MARSSLLPTVAVSVSDITRYLRQVMESDEVLQDVWVEGELSNLARPVSGHIYFSVKDASASLKCVIWKSNALRIKVALQNGMAVEAHGYISVYEPAGQYQLYVDTLRPAGEGYLYQEFVRLKARLEEEGLFAQERKRPIPARPRRIGIVTSATGAALQDMLNTLRRRYPLAEVVLAPAAVQGSEAPTELVAALRALNTFGDVDVILIGRGGGSLEDLWAFNDERVVRAVAASRVPVIAGVGHETDFTLTDFAADLRAPTPTGAAVQATPDIYDLKLELLAAQNRLGAALEDRVSYERSALEGLMQRMQGGSPLRSILNYRQRQDDLWLRMGRGLGHSMSLRRARLTGIEERLHSLNPLAVLERGYAVVRRADGAVVTRVEQVAAGQDLTVRVSDGEFDTRVIGAQKNE
jgi:exodeoxyribonuclease VII large subunit